MEKYIFVELKVLFYLVMAFRFGFTRIYCVRGKMKMSNYTVVLTFLVGVLSGISSFLTAQPAFKTTNEKYVIEKKLLTAEDGLASRDAYSSVMDQQGFMWFATSMGLNRYDGKSFELFTKETSGLVNNFVRSLAVSDNDKLIIHYFETDKSKALNHPLGEFQVMNINSHKLQTLEQAFPDLPFPSKELWAIKNDGPGQLILMRHQPSEVWRYTTQKGFKKIASFKINSSVSDRFYDFYPTLVNGMVIYDGKISFRFDLDSTTSYSFQVSSDGAHLRELPVTGLFATHIDTSGLFHYYQTPTANSSKEGFRTINANGQIQINDLLPQLPHQTIPYWNVRHSNVVGEFLYSDWGYGIYVFMNDAFIQIYDGTELFNFSDVHIEHCYKDHYGNYWLCSSIGVFKISIKERVFQNYFTKEKLGKGKINQIRGIYAIPGEAGDAIEQIFCNSWDAFMTAPNIKIDEITSTSLLPIVLHANALFLGSGFNLIYKYDIHSRQLQTLHAPIGMTTWALMSVNDSILLTGNGEVDGDGIRVLNTRTNTCKNVTSLNSTYPLPYMVYRIVQTKSKGIIALAENGIYRIDNSFHIAEYWGPKAESNHRIPISEFYDLHEDKEGVCWIASANQGLFRWEWNTTLNGAPLLKQYTISNGLPSNRLYRIEEDEKHNLWIGTYNGLMRFNTINLSINTFTAQDGLSHNEFNRISSFKSASGTMYFGGVNGLNVFDPSDVENVYNENNYPLRLIHFDKFSSDKNILISCLDEYFVNNKITLDQSDEFISLDFSLLDFKSYTHHYKYLIEGLEKNWIDLNEGVLRISRLPYGNYTLRIKAQLENGLWNKNELRIPIVVQKPIYRKPLFWISVLVVLFFLVLGFFVFRQKRLASRNRKLEQMVTARTEGLKKSLSERDVLLAEIHHRVKNNLQTISALLQMQKRGLVDKKAIEALTEGQNRISSIALVHSSLYQNDNLFGLEFESFVQDLCVQVKDVYFDFNYNIKLEINVPKIKFDIDTAIPLGLILNEFITNTFKYASQEDEQLFISISLMEDQAGHFTLVYSDNGGGLPVEIDISSTKSFGLKLVRGLAKQLAGDFTYSSDEGISKLYITFKSTALRELR